MHCSQHAALWRSHQWGGEWAEFFQGSGLLFKTMGTQREQFIMFSVEETLDGKDLIHILKFKSVLQPRNVFLKDLGVSM